ncbi:hypothetical protein Z043_114114 [Scleropages formosus]|uniref:EF-hand domain-containing protein n=1 Tax=Scleropages formosus TaxID=113540 RepID=A0A0P7YIU3_SCLFO|nr:hypothetical protein Z043_114114 [Scleropages formosus]
MTGGSCDARVSVIIQPFEMSSAAAALRLRSNPNAYLSPARRSEGAALSKGSEGGSDSGLDFGEADKELVSFNLDKILQGNALDLNQLFQSSGYSGVDQILSWDTGSTCPMLQWGDGSSQEQDFQHKEAVEAAHFPTVPREHTFSNSFLDDVDFSGSLDLNTKDVSLQELDVLQSELVEPMDVRDIFDKLTDDGDAPASSESPALVQTLDCKWEDSPLADTSPGQVSSSGTSPSSGASSLGVGKESDLVLVSQGGETVSCETRDKGLACPLLEDELTQGNSIQEGSPKSSPGHSAALTGCGKPQELLESSFLLPGTVSLDTGLTVCESQASECACSSTAVPADEQGSSPDAVPIGFSVECREDEDVSSPLTDLLSTEPLHTDPPVEGDASCVAELLPSPGPGCNVSGDLMAASTVQSLAKFEVNESPVLEFTLSVESMCDLEPDKDSEVPQGNIPAEPPAVKLDDSFVELDVTQHVVCETQECGDRLDQAWYAASTGSLRSGEQMVEGLSLPEVGASATLPVRSGTSPSEEDLSPLKAVFDALDQDGDGFVRIEEFVQFATVYGAEQTYAVAAQFLRCNHLFVFEMLVKAFFYQSASSASSPGCDKASWTLSPWVLSGVVGHVKDLTRFLDPSGLGVISFEDFYRGISAISNGGSEPPLYSVGFSPEEAARGSSEEYDDCAAFEQNEVTDSAYLGSESTYSECETFTDEDTGTLVHPELHEEVETDSAIDTALHDPDDAGSRLSLGSELNSHSLVTVIGGEEEHFEDFGEGRRRLTFTVASVTNRLVAWRTSPHA